MSDDFHALLDATLGHLQDLKARGVRSVNISPEILQALRQPVVVRRPSPPEVTPSLAESAPSAVRTSVPSKPTFSQPAIAPVTPPQPVFSLEAMDVPAVLPDRKLDALTPEAKTQAMADLRARALVCTRCPHLAASRKNVAFGVGSIHAQLMFVGEAPGADEDVQGEPFVGAAGQLLTKIIQAMGLTRQTVYIANILKCRPDTPGQASGNRKPTPQEMQTCIPYLHEQIDLIQPKVLVALGATAVEGLLAKTGIMKLRGHWHTYRGIPLMPTFHPAYLLRNQALAEKRRVWEDMMLVMEKLGMPISEKQRGFFLRAMGT